MISDPNDVRPLPVGNKGESDLALERETLRESVAHDFTTTESGIVPLDRRRSAVTLGAVWLVLEAGWVYIFTGFALFQAGLNLAETSLDLLLGVVFYFAYSMVAAFIGSRSGQTHSLLSRSIFGIVGSGLISLVVFGVQMGWAGYQANLTAALFGGLYGWTAILAIGVVLGVVMVFNNLFGFTGLATYARYIVSPLLILWVVYLVIRGLLEGHATTTNPQAVAPLTQFAAIGTVIGAAVWGAEPDYWRYGKPKFWFPSLPLAFALIVGLFLSGLAGWTIANLSPSLDFGPAVGTATHLSLFGLTWLAFIVILITQVGINDGNYYESINAIQNLLGGIKRWKRLYSALICTAGAALAAWIIPYVISNGFYKLAAFTAIGVPSATVIMAVDHFLLPRLFRVSRPLDRVPTWTEAGKINWAAVFALVVSVTFGSFATGLLGNNVSYWGLAPVETWIAAGAIYVLAVWVSRALRPDFRSILGFSSIISRAEADNGSAVDIGAPRVA
jgi:purine-cytosine permease-like protein